MFGPHLRTLCAEFKIYWSAILIFHLTGNVRQSKLAAMARMDQTADYHFVRVIRSDSRSFAYRQCGQGWLQSQRPIDSGRRALRLDIDSCIHLAYCATHESLYQTSAANAHCPDSMDGSDLCIECSKYI